MAGLLVVLLLLAGIVLSPCVRQKLYENAVFHHVLPPRRRPAALLTAADPMPADLWSSVQWLDDRHLHALPPDAPPWTN